MEQPNGVVDYKPASTNSSYKPSILAIPMDPGNELGPFENYPKKDLDVVVLITYPSGTVPNEGRYSFIPFIQETTDAEVPVYMLRGSLTAAEKPSWEAPKVRTLETYYGPEGNAIKAGAIPLERPDASQYHEVMAAIREIYSDKPSYDEGIEAVSNLFSRPEFLERVKEIRDN